MLERIYQGILFLVAFRNLDQNRSVFACDSRKCVKDKICEENNIYFNLSLKIQQFSPEKK